MDTSSEDQGSCSHNNQQGESSQDAEAVSTNLSSHFEEFLKQHQLQQLEKQNQKHAAEALLGQGSAQMMGNVEVDESPLKPSLNRNKESLKLKLQMRRPFNQLVDQGILPSPNTPPAFACQRVKLERARMSDLLKAKIQQRPSRQELVRQHILEETDSRVAPLLAEKQRMLKRARLADSLNDHLIHRPGPLELVQKNILHAPDESIEKAIKEGIVPFKATYEGAIPGPSLPTKYICQEDDSSSDVSSPSVSSNLDSTPAEENEREREESSLPPVVVTLPSETESLKSPESVQMIDAPPKPEILPQNPQIAFSSVPIPPPFPFTTNLSEIKVPLQNTQPQQSMGIFAVPIFTNTSPQPVTATISQAQQPLYNHSQSSIKSRTKKICKPKSQPKPKTIKFHEYKGPPSAQKSGGLGSLDLSQRRPGESSYELLLQQQQLFLQWQLEWQHRFPKILLPAVSKMSLSAEDKKSFCSSISSLPIVTNTVSPITATTVFPSTVSHHQSIQPCLTASGANENVPMQIISTSSLTPAFCRENSVLILSSAPTITSENQTKPVVNTQISPAISGFQNSVGQPTTFIITNPGTPVPVKVSETITESDPQILEPPNIKSSISLKLNDWKVNELKTELKKRNLPVSGSKSQLLERLQLSYLKNPEIKTSSILEQGSGNKESSTINTTTPLEKSNVVGGESGNQGRADVTVPHISNVQPTAQELKFYVANTGNGATTISLPNALEFLQKSGVLSTEKDSKGGPTQVFIQPNSRSVLQQKIQQKLLQQAIKNQNQLKENKKSLNEVKTALTSPLVTSVGIINQQELRTWIPSSTIAISTNNVQEKEIIESKDPGKVTVKTEASSNQPCENAWVLKINESNEAGPTEFQKSFENCLADLLSDATELPSGDGGIEVNLDADADHIKSQMVDDVLEILIRNGELPPSAAQHLPGHEKQDEVPEHEKPGFIPPPAPPLPPSTFAITLPTEITFRKTNATSTSHLIDSDHPGTLEAQVSERKGSLGITLLTKDAQEILKISEELATFGKSHSEIATTESQNPQPPHLLTTSAPFASGIKTERKECDSKVGLNGNVADSMELCSMEESHSMSLHSDAGLLNGMLQGGHVLRPPGNTSSDETSMDISIGRDHFPGIITLAKSNNGEQSITELLTEDLEFPMDTEYSDWLESFSSDNAFTNNFSGNKTEESNKLGSISSVLGNNKVVRVDDRPHGSILQQQDSQFGSQSSMSLTNDPFSHRDPLLSSKSSTRMLLTANNHNNILDNCSNLVDSSGNVLMDIDTETDLRRKDGHTPSALDVNVNDLWDFSF